MKLVACVKGSYICNKANKKLGGCFNSQYILMVLKLKKLHFETRYIDEPRKHLDSFFASLDSTMLPVLAVLNDDGTKEAQYQDADEISNFLEETFPEIPLRCDDEELSHEVVKITPFSKLSKWIRTPHGTEKIYEEELRKVNTLLRSRPGVFLGGDELNLHDCKMLAKLYHTEVAAQFVKGYVIPDSFPELKKYMKEAKKRDVFKETCPDLDEIYEKWRDIKK